MRDLTSSGRVKDEKNELALGRGGGGEVSVDKQFISGNK